MLPLVFAGIVLTYADLLLAPASLRSSANITVTITPAKATLFANEVQTFVTIVEGIDDKSVNWAVEEEDGGTITDSGVYTAPKIQGVYHISATSKAKPRTKAVAVVTVLAYCDPPVPAFGR